VWVKRALQASSTHSIIYGKRWYYTAQNLRDKSTQEFGLITENLSLKKKMPRMKWDQAKKKIKKKKKESSAEVDAKKMRSPSCGSWQMKRWCLFRISRQPDRSLGKKVLSFSLVYSTDLYSAAPYYVCVSIGKHRFRGEKGRTRTQGKSD
jgi:hypothetical protein